MIWSGGKDKVSAAARCRGSGVIHPELRTHPEILRDSPICSPVFCLVPELGDKMQEMLSRERKMSWPSQQITKRSHMCGSGATHWFPCENVPSEQVSGGRHNHHAASACLKTWTVSPAWPQPMRGLLLERSISQVRPSVPQSSLCVTNTACSLSQTAPFSWVKPRQRWCQAATLQPCSPQTGRCIAGRVPLPPYSQLMLLDHSGQILLPFLLVKFASSAINTCTTPAAERRARTGLGARADLTVLLANQKCPSGVCGRRGALRAHRYHLAATAGGSTERICAYLTSSPVAASEI